MSLLLLFHGSAAPPVSSSVQAETAIFMQASTLASTSIVASHHTGLMSAHTVTVAGKSMPWIGEIAIHMQSSTRKFVPTSMVPGSMSMLGVGL